ncbi:MAG: ABC transporter ATP-binding protein [Betaproteobacteria bacterium]|nr:ABC transporter ATP-binding protein [Gammaproteobacteria bacterium]MDH3436377.1 ABC transporter ATP-binding protein [Betaproteobacteria bacterium]
MTEHAIKARKHAAGVSIEDVNLYYGNNHVLKEVSLAIEPGEFFTFLGPSGCGKTTLLRLIAGFGNAQTGRVRIGGKDITALPPWQRDVGMVFQSYALWPHMTVRRNVAFGLEERRLPKPEIWRRVDAVLELVGLSELAERRPSQLSGGQQQRVALARTIVVEPQVLLLDEPLSNLDAKLRVQMRQELLELQRKLALTTIFVTHDQEEANTTADRIAVMSEGVVQQVGTPTELYDNPANRFVASFLGMANVLDGRLASDVGTTVFHSASGITVPLSSSQVANRGTGDSHSIMFRPQSVAIRPAGAPEPRAGVSMQGVIQHQEFLGNLTRYAVAVGESVILVDDAHQPNQRSFSVCTRVGLSLASEQVVILTD